MCHVESFQKGICYNLGDGERIVFWSNIWCGNMPLKHLFPAIYLMAENCLARVGDYMDTSLDGGT